MAIIATLLYRKPAREAARRADLLVRQLDLAGLEHRPTRTLSGGQRLPDGPPFADGMTTGQLAAGPAQPLPGRPRDREKIAG